MFAAMTLCVNPEPKGQWKCVEFPLRGLCVRRRAGRFAGCRRPGPGGGRRASGRPRVAGGEPEAEDLAVLDIRNRIDGGSAETFAEGHIPGAV